MEEKIVTIPGGCSAVFAEYKEQIIPEYKGNRLIEALPSLISEIDLAKKLEVNPPYDPAERMMEKELRLHCIPRIFDFYQPLTRNLILHQSFSLLLRQGYVSRNPQRRETIIQLHQNYQQLINANNEINTTAAGFSLIGISGIGKTKAVHRELSLIPQIIIHKTPLNFYQITWLKLECPKTLKGLCIDFFIEVDRLLGTNYQKFAKQGASVEIMLAHMVQVARLHYIGVLVIDEVQNLHTTKVGGAASILDFFVNMVNKIGIPVVFIGTLEALTVLQSEFRQARRGSGQGDMVWKRLEQNEEWDMLIEEMWKYQWTKKDNQLTQQIKDVLYDESQGIIDIAIKLYVLSQRHVIFYDTETITPRIISMVAKTYLNLVQPGIAALRAGEENTIQIIESPKENKEGKKARKTNNPCLSELIKETNNQKVEPMSMFDQLILELVKLEINRETAIQIAEEVLSKNEHISLVAAIKEALILSLRTNSQVTQRGVTIEKTSRKGKKTFESNPYGLRTIINQGRENKKSAYETLKDAGLIKSPITDFKI